MGQEPISMRRKLIHVVFLVCLAFVAAVAGVWTADRGAVIQIVETRADKPVKPGGQLQIVYRVNRFRVCQRQVFREIIDGQGLRHVLGIQPNPVPGPLGYDSYTVLVAVPPVVQPGLGEYRVTIEDYCNPLHYMWPLVTHIKVPILISTNGAAEGTPTHEPY